VRRYPSAKDLAKITRPGRYAIGHGAYLQIGPNGGRSWGLRYRKGNKSTCMGLGCCDYVTLAEARQKAIDVQRQRIAGLDPLSEKRRLRAHSPLTTNIPTFERAALQFISEREASWRNGASARQWRGSLQNYVFPAFGQMSVADITTHSILAAVRPIWTTIPETARRVRNRVELIMSYAIAHGWRSGDNPASWQILKNLLPDLKGNGQAHHSAMAYRDVPALMARLLEDTSVVANALAFTILTAARAGEAGGAKWSEIGDGVWVVPASRMKAHREHKVPLSSGAQSLLASLPRLDEHLFPANKRTTVRPGTMLKCLRRFDPVCTVHGFRSAFSTWASECTKHPDHLVELALAHTVGGAVERAYRRSDLFEARRALMEDWANFLNSGTKPA
jgi:integrase